MVPAPETNATSIRVRLPGGIWLDDDDEAPPHREVELRGVRADDELALLDNASLSPAERASALLARCLENGNRIAPRLAVGDREAALLHLRRLTIGDTIDAILACPSDACGARLELQLRVSDLLGDPYDQVRRVHDVTVDAPDGAYAVSFRLPTSDDLVAVATTAAADAHRAANLILRRCVVQATRNAQPVDIDELPEALCAAVGTAMAERDPQAELDLELRCPSCDLVFSVIFDVARFFLRELDDRASRVLADVHVLASHYHWSERDILQMPATRRARYLELVAHGSRQGGRGALGITP